MRSIIFYCGIILKLIISSFSQIKVRNLTKKGLIKERDEYIHKTTRTWANSILKLAGIKVDVVGEENLPKDKTILFVSNHQGNFDIPLVMGAIDVPKGFIAKKELETWPIISTWMKSINCVFMDRSNLRKSAEAIIQGTKLLKEGHSIVVFPEGTRSKGGPVQDFKAGSFKLATKSKCVVVPLTIDGTYNFFEEHNGWIHGGTVKLTIHKPIDVSTLSKEETDNLHSTVQSIICSAL